MKKLLIVIAVILVSCTNEKDFQTGKEQLENQGYTDVVNTGYSAFCCDEKDQFSTGFTAKDRSGRTVKGCICSGVVKGVTIRWE